MKDKATHLVDDGAPSDEGGSVVPLRALLLSQRIPG